MDINENETNDREMLFYNFKLHDYDHNLLLDGLELLAAIRHDKEMVKLDTNENVKKFILNFLFQIADRVFKRCQ